MAFYINTSTLQLLTYSGPFGKRIQRKGIALENNISPTQGTEHKVGLHKFTLCVEYGEHRKQAPFSTF